MLGGATAREDAASHASSPRYDCVRILNPSRPDLFKQTTRMLKRVGLTGVEQWSPKDISPDIGVLGRASRAHIKDTVSEKIVAVGSLAHDERARIEAHAQLWRRCRDNGKPLLIMEDGLTFVAKIGVVVAHLTATVDRVCDPTSTPVVILLASQIHPTEGWKEQWMPTDLQMPDGEKVVLREPAAVHAYASVAYVVWPLAARRLLAALPVRSPLTDVFNHHFMSETLRALAPAPIIGMPALDEYAPPKPRVRYKVVFQPRVAVRHTPSPDGMIAGARKVGEVLEAIEQGGPKDNWIKLGDKEWVMITHPQHGTLLERLPRDPQDEDDEDEDGAAVDLQ